MPRSEPGERTSEANGAKSFGVFWMLLFEKLPFLEKIDACSIVSARSCIPSMNER